MYQISNEGLEKIRAHTPSKEQKELIKRVQRGFAYVELETGRVFTDADAAFTGRTEYLGTLPRKLIPDRRRMEREARERPSLERITETEPRRKHIEGEAGIYMLMAEERAKKR